MDILPWASRSCTHTKHFLMLLWVIHHKLFDVHFHQCTFNTVALSTLRNMLIYKKDNNTKIPTITQLFHSLAQHFTACFSKIVIRMYCHTFQGCYDSISTTHKNTNSLTYLHTSELIEPKGYQTTLIYFKTTTLNMIFSFIWYFMLFL